VLSVGQEQNNHATLSLPVTALAGSLALIA